MDFIMLRRKLGRLLDKLSIVYHSTKTVQASTTVST